MKERVLELIPEKQKELKEFTAKYSEKTLGNVTVGQVRDSHKMSAQSIGPTQSRPSPPPQAIGGARDVKCMFWDISLLDAQEVRETRACTEPGRTNCADV
jgi:hypothetical protein